MRREILDLIKKYLDEGKIRESVLDVGGAGTEYQRSQGYDLRELFELKNIVYHITDIHKSEGVDFTGDFLKLNISRKYRTVLCTEMLEHCKNPYEIVRRCYKQMNDNGLIIVTVPDQYGVHCSQDYYRFTTNGLHMLCEQFEHVESGDFGSELNHDLEHWFVGKKNSPPLRPGITKFTIGTYDKPKVQL